jgi:ADP-ribose pyrophosphatase
MDRAVEPGGFEIKRAIVQHAGSAVMMPVDAQERVLLVRQYRLPARAYLWELSAGRIDPGETPLKAAKRELIEETGFRARKWLKLGAFFASPGYVAERMTIFAAQDLTAGEATPMEDERIETRWFPMREIAAMIESGRIQDAKTIVGYALWQMKRRQTRSGGKR